MPSKPKGPWPEKFFAGSNLPANLRHFGSYILEAANYLEKQMSDRGVRENDLINRLKLADAKIAEQATTITTLQGQVPDAIDNAVDARATAILTGQADPGDPINPAPAAAPTPA